MNGLTCGVFDLLHVNHIRFIREAASLCDRLYVAINTDRVTKILKGDDRPFVPQIERLEVIKGIKGVYYAFLFDDLDPCRIIQIWKPDLFFKGKDREGTEIPEAKVLPAGALRFIGPPKDHSTTDLLARLSRV